MIQQHTLKVSIVQCLGLPKVDMLGSCDAYVQLWIAHSDPNKFKQALTDNEEGIKQTKVVTSLNPEFGESFVFKYPNVVSDEEDPMDRYLMVRVVDKNSILKDEVIGFVMIQFFGLNLKVGKPIRQTLPLIDAKSGSIELILEAIPHINPTLDSATIQNQPISLLYRETFITVGPIIGIVTSTSARVLVECSKPICLNMEIFRVCERSHFNVEESFFEKKVSVSHPKPPNNTLISMEKQEETIFLNSVSIEKPYIPYTFQLDGLKPDTVYRIEFKNVCNNTKRVGIIKTMIDENLLAQNPDLSHKLTMNCVSCNFIERREPGKDTWERLNEQIDSTDILLHMGDQIYADYGHNSYDEAVKICNGRNKISDEDEEFVKDQFRKYYRLNWNHIPTRKVMSQVSNLMILDDYEIRDDWGSQENDQTPGSIPYYVGSLAREVYWEYQRSLRGDVSNKSELFNKHEAYYNIIGDTGIVVLDLRAARSFLINQAGGKMRFLTQDQWNDVNNWMLNGGPLSSPNVKSLVIVCSVPLVFLNKGITDKLPKLNTELDDFKDHFVFGDHFPEQLELLELMRKWKQDTKRNGIFLGGDVHIGGSTSIFKGGKLICEQLTSSAICNGVIPLIEGTIIKALIGVSDELVNGWTFKHRNWKKERNYGLIQIGVNEKGKEKEPIINAYLNTYKEAFLK